MASRDLGGEGIAVDRQGVAAGNARAMGDANQQGIQAPQLLLEQPGGGWPLVRLQRVAANQLSKAVGAMRPRLADGTHFVEDDGEARAGNLPCGFAACQACADDMDGRQVLF